jgi:hypothetical protein
VTHADDGTLHVDAGGKPTSARNTVSVLGRYVCGESARIKAPRIGVADEAYEAKVRLPTA